MDLIKCDQCGNTFTSQFCPDCGQNRDNIKVIEPVVITTYVHSNGENNELPQELGVNSEDNKELYSNITHLNYEVRIDYKLEDGKLTATHIDCGDGQGLCKITPLKKWKMKNIYWL